MKKMVWLVVGCMLVIATVQAQESREAITIRWLAKTLKRMGEDATAKRLMDDYFVKKTVRFRFIHSADGNAETDPGRPNVMVLSDALLNIAEADRLLQKNPYSDRSPLISGALTVMHEYVHVDQQNPQNFPQWEDPAWHVSDQALANWVARLEKQYNDARKLPASAEKTKKLNELKDILKRLKSELAITRNSVASNAANRSISPNQLWKLDATEAKIKELEKRIFDYESFGKMIPATTKAPAGFWEMIDEKAFDKLSASETNYSLAAASGSIQANWWLNNDQFKTSSNFTPPPKRITATDKIPINMSVTINNQGSDYSANGNFSLFFDNPGIEPGSIISPIWLKDDKGVVSSINFTHRLGVAPSPASSLSVYLNGSDLPKAVKGKKIVLMAAVCIGRCAGYQYIYEWKDGY